MAEKAELHAKMKATMVERFPPGEIAQKLAVAVSLGMLVGLEREWAHKDIGVRTFALTSMLGMLTMLLGAQFSIMALLSTLVLVAFVNWRSILADGSLEITTSAALLVTLVLGMLVGEGHLFTPFAAAIVMTMLLAWKTELRRFAGGLKPEEIRSAVLLGLLGLVIYPILPEGFIDPWHLVNPKQAWITIVIVALLGFVNYVLLKMYSARGLYYSAILGGLVNSTATAAELSGWLRSQPELQGMAVGVMLLTVVAMFARNLLLLAFFAPSALSAAVIPLGLMSLVAALFAFRYRGDTKAVKPHQLQLGSPVSLGRVLTFGMFLLAVGAAGTLAQRYFGQFGFLTVSAIGGLVSSASTTAAAGNLVKHGSVVPAIAGVATVLTSVTSALINLPIVQRQANDPRVIRPLFRVTCAIVLLGLITLAAMWR
jgi:uncharacterized membrane protein (DUF4010 family)